MQNSNTGALAKLFTWFLASTIISLVLAGNALAETEPLFTHEQLFDRTRLLDVQIEIAEADWNDLRLQTRNFAMALMKPPRPSPFTYSKGNVIIDGHRIESVGIRKKGFIGSLDEDRPSLKINLSKYVDQTPVSGLNMLTLNNNKQPGALASQMLTYQMFADAELPAPRCNIARVTVNGKLLGVYSHVESIKKPMLQRQFGNAAGKLYEGTLADFFEDRIEDLELKTGDKNRAELLALAKVLAAEGELNLDELGQQVDLDEFMRFWALEALINFWDGYTQNQNNYFAYHNPLDSKFHFLPWGADCAFAKFPIYGQFDRGWESLHSNAALPNRLYHTDGMADRYRDAMNGLLDTVWNEEAILAEIDHIEELAEGNTHENQAGFRKELDQSRSFVKKRRDQMQRELNRWPKRITPKPRDPFYTVNIGKVSGSFHTTWHKKAPGDPYTSGDGALELTLDGETVEFTKLGTYAMVSAWKGFDGQKPPTVVFTGKRKSNGIRVTLSVSASPESFRGATNGRPVVAQGSLLEGVTWILNPMRGFRMLGGTVTFDESGMEESDVVRGTVELDIAQMQGSMQ